MRNQFGYPFKLAAFNNTEEQKDLSLCLFAFLVDFIQFVNVPLSARPNAIFDCLVHVIIVVAANYKALRICNFSVIALVELIDIFQVGKISDYLVYIFVRGRLLKRKFLSRGSRLGRGLRHGIFHKFVFADSQRNFSFNLHKKQINFIKILFTKYIKILFA